MGSGKNDGDRPSRSMQGSGRGNKGQEDTEEQREQDALNVKRAVIKPVYEMCTNRVSAAAERLNAFVHRLSTATEELKEAIASITPKERRPSKRWRQGRLKKETKSHLNTRGRRCKKKVEFTKETKSHLNTRGRRCKKKVAFTPEDALRAAGWQDAESLSNNEDEQDNELVCQLKVEEEASHQPTAPLRTPAPSDSHFPLQLIENGNDHPSLEQSNISVFRPGAVPKSHLRTRGVKRLAPRDLSNVQSCIAPEHVGRYYTSDAWALRRIHNVDGLQRQEDEIPKAQDEVLDAETNTDTNVPANADAKKRQEEDDKGEEGEIDDEVTEMELPP